MLFHTDSPSKKIPDAKTFSDQFMTGKQFQSGGIHGDGAYFAKDAETSWDYGYGPKAAQAYNKIINCHQVYYGKKRRYPPRCENNLCRAFRV